MNTKYKHIPVMMHETIKSLNIQKNGIYIDSTFGMGGHSKEILKKLGEHGQLYSLDRDPYAIIESKKIQDKRFTSAHINFSKIFFFAKEKKIVNKIDGVLFDLGVSSPQIENATRGFSFRMDGPLDMRMNPQNGISVANWLLKSNVNQISYVLKKFGEEQFARRIAFAIKKYHTQKKINSTLELVNIIKKAIPVKNKFKHPARKTFQALRIYINQELEELKTGLTETLKILKPGGRITIISFHSLEDRIVKKFMVQNSKKAIVPYGMPITEKQLNDLKTIKLNIINRISPSATEIKNNPKSRSAILRVAEFNRN